MQQEAHMTSKWQSQAFFFFFLEPGLECKPPEHGLLAATICHHLLRCCLKNWAA